MDITPKFKFVEGSFNTKTNRMLVIASDNHGTVELCFKEEDCGWNIPFAKIKLFDSGLYKDFKATMEDARKLGEEIARRWNECADKR
ncbi:hypothetical protein [Prevotella lacticifex]|uniref:Uncharacterized protein n=1 Tax=Prevotella lacticifex TaxID=2854755 RepID=A0A9R1CAL3_9BACT|nr:hypothetical protein [Prevotella lacticifex]GJG35762.1 hypothetical protein PRLR5003_09190 [Prevotella lacticifex]GJG39189.1 hypothetical protein PRLR5019_11600 [Prevotella lacticifex]GJG42131.1 hypothetical protein PRLR5025_09170 [Prevotella lacticifex]GJG45543.1 hypothetical protein PRLR5027_11380 [Prevotella lacticifex]GJG48482.1 hypothetical protein PRLR5052_08950 [Prevotella lacticifex]